MFEQYPEWVRLAVVLAFPLIAFGAALIAVFLGGHEHDRSEEIQQGSGDWLWP